MSNLEHDESELRRIHLDVLESTSEEELLEKFRQAKADLLERRRQRILWDAAMIMSSYRKEHAATHESAPTLSELRSRLAQLTPKVIESRLKDLETEFEYYQNFEKDLFEPRLWEQIPGNWRYEAATKEEFVAKLRERNRDHLETVKAAIPYLKEIIRVHEDVLSEKVASLKLHEPKVPGLVKECTRLAREASAIRRQVTELIHKLERSNLNDRDKAKVGEKIIVLIRKHRQLEAQHGPIYEKLAQYTVDRREILDSVPSIPSSRYNLPYWLQIKLEEKRR